MHTAHPFIWSPFWRSLMMWVQILKLSLVYYFILVGALEYQQILLSNKKLGRGPEIESSQKNLPKRRLRFVGVGVLQY